MHHPLSFGQKNSSSDGSQRAVPSTLGLFGSAMDWLVRFLTLPIVSPTNPESDQNLLCWIWRYKRNIYIYIYHMWWKCLEEKNWCAFWLRLVMKSSNIPVIIWYYFASSLVRRRSEPFKLEKRAGHTRWPSLSRKISCTSSTNCYILYVQFLSIVYSRES